MIEKTLAKRYAAALLSISQKEGKIDETGALLDALRRAYQESPVLRAAMHQPKIPRREKKRLLRKPFEATAAKSFLEFLDLLIEKNRVGIISEIAEAYEKISDAVRGIVRVQARSFLPLTPSQQAMLQAKLAALTGRTVEIETSPDPSLKGGMQIRMGDTVVDGTVARRLSALREQLAKF